MERVLFLKGRQRWFLDLTVRRLNCISVRGLLQFGVKTSYDCLKNYYAGRRLIPRELFLDLCYLARIDFNGLMVRFLSDNWGQVKGGRARRNK